ncbi:MAG TPA: hypothetical protein VGK34_09140 [Armatimonadota bacterium]|jgi:hypothetical protein
MEKEFIGKVYRTIALTWIIATLLVLASGKIWLALSISLGVALGAFVLASDDLLVRRLFVPGAKRPISALWKLTALKYTGVVVALFFLMRWHRFSVIAFLVGILLTHFAILAKLAGIKIVERLKKNAAETVSKEK